MQDTLLEAVLDALADIRQASLDLTTMLVVGAPLLAGSRLLNAAVVVHRGGCSVSRPSPTCRTTASSTRSGSSRPATSSRVHASPSLGRDRAARPDLIFQADDVPGLPSTSRSARTCGCPCRRARRRRSRARPCCSTSPASPITVARAEDRRLIVRSRVSSAACAAYVYTAAGQGESSTDLSWDGQTMVYEVGDLLGRDRALPRRRARHRRRRRPGAPAPGAAEAGHLRRQPARAGTAGGTAGFRRSPSASTRRRRHRPAPQAGPPPLRPRRRRAAWRSDCYEAYNIQVTGLAQRLAPSGTPKIIIGVSGGLDSTHALIVAAKAMDRLGRPRTDILGFTMPGFATGEAPRTTRRGSLKSLGVTFAEIDIRPAAEHMLARPGPPVRRRRAGLRHHLRERPGRPAHRLPLPARQPPRRHRARHWRPLGARARLVHVRRRRPDVALRRQRRRAEDADPAPHPLGARQRPVRRRQRQRRARDPRRRRSAPSSSRPRRARRRNPPRPRSARTRCRTSPCSTCCATVPAEQDRFLAWHAWHDADDGDWPPGSRSSGRTEYDLATIRRWLECSLQPVLRLRQFKRSAMPNGPKVSAGGTMSPRGDWRMPSDATPAAWLDGAGEERPAGLTPSAVSATLRLQRTSRQRRSRPRPGRVGCRHACCIRCPGSAREPSFHPGGHRVRGGADLRRVAAGGRSGERSRPAPVVRPEGRRDARRTPGEHLAHLQRGPARHGHRGRPGRPGRRCRAGHRHPGRRQGGDRAARRGPAGGQVRRRVARGLLGRAPDRRRAQPTWWRGRPSRRARPAKSPR